MTRSDALLEPLRRIEAPEPDPAAADMAETLVRLDEKYRRKAPITHWIAPGKQAVIVEDGDSKVLGSVEGYGGT